MRRDIGKNLGVHIMGNAPFGHHSYEFDEERLETSEGRKGAKVRIVDGDEWDWWVHVVCNVVISCSY